jgi:hypothetical protein
MATSKKKPDRATAVPPEVMGTKQEKIDGGRKLVAAMQKSSDWTLAAGVQKSALDWAKVMDDWQANGQSIVDVRAQLVKLEANELTFERRWDTKKRATGSAVTDYADGSKDVVNGFGWAVLGHHLLAPAGIPTNLRDKHSKVHGTAAAVWDTLHGKHDFQVQYTTNTADPSTFSAPITTSKATFKLPGQTRGTVIYVRVRTVDPKLPGSVSDWTQWVPIQVG